MLLILLGYAIGNINPAYLISKAKKVDIRKVGSSNPGASNITMTFGWKFGIITGVVDILKAFIPVLVFRLLGYDEFDQLLVGTSVIIGHIYPVVFKFKGGKGTASFVGMMMAINPIIGLILSAIIILVTIISDFIALGTIAMMNVWMVLSFVYYDMYFFYLSLLIPLLSIYKHIPNVIKILNKKESGLRATFKK